MIVGIWDDHDYGINDGNKHFEYKDEFKELFLDFLNEPKESQRRKQPGIYTSYKFGPPNRQVKLILLDVRYFADRRTDIHGETLGEQQWKWLES